jgi:murein DD-endopeptidase MepM/ murein hydrolase activator NlpD
MYARLLALVAAAAVALALLVPLLAAAAGPGMDASPLAAQDIPERMLRAYLTAGQACPALSWTVLAAIGKLESDHARAGGSAVADDGAVDPWVIGVALDGAGGTAAIRDTDEGRWDRDMVWDRAVGPMQFIPATWAAYGLDGSDDGQADPHNADDATLAAAAYLCAHGADDPATLRAAILAYNNADWYADQVLALAAAYAAGAAVTPEVGGGIVCPVPGAEFIDSWGYPRSGGRTHKGQDLFAAAGTPILADGVVIAASDVDRGLGGITVWVRTHDGAAWYFAHNLANAVAVGQPLAAGEVIAWVGNTGNAASTPAHTHVQWRPTGSPPDVNPYPLLDAACPGH